MGWKRMFLDHRTCRFVLIFFVLMSLIPSTGEASLLESRLSTGEQMSERSEKIESIRTALEHKLVAQRLQDYGLSQEEAMARLHTLDDEQLHQLASLSDEIGGGNGVGLVISVLVIILLVVLILKLSDRTIVIQ